MILKPCLVIWIILALFTPNAEFAAIPDARLEAAADPVVTRMVDRATKQRSELVGYSVMRRYTVRNHHLSRNAVMTTLLVYQAGKGKHFAIVHEEGANGIVGRVLHSILKEEEKLSRQRFPPGDINKSNYRFVLLGKQMQDGRLCYRLKLIPRRRSKYLIAGDLWVDVKELAVVCLEGRPSGSVSFWVGQPFVEQHFQSVNGFWMPSRNQSTAEVKLAGQTEFTIDCWDYKFQTPSIALANIASQAVNWTGTRLVSNLHSSPVSRGYVSQKSALTLKTRRMHTEKRFNVFGEPVEVLISSAATSGAISVITQTCEPGGGPPPHWHANEDELFIVLEGRFEIFNGKVWREIIRGAVAFKAKGEVHTFRNCGTKTGKIMCVSTPGGLDEYLEQISNVGMPEAFERLIEISKPYGVSFVLPLRT